MDSQRICAECSGHMKKNTYLYDAPQLLILHIPCGDIKINRKMKISGKSMSLKGIVYHGRNHYTSRILTADKNVWFHDGMMTGSKSQHEGTTVKIKSNFLNKCKRKSVVIVVYAQDEVD